MIAVSALGILLVSMVIGISIPLSFFISAAFICVIGGHNPIMLLAYGYNKTNSILLLSIPLFVLAGAIIDKGGIGVKLIEGLQKIVKESKAALGTVTIIACAIFGAVSGSAAATLSCIGSIMTPRLKEAGYSDGHIGAILASSGVLGIMVPPSILMILFAWSTGTSVLACFLATIIPGILLVTLFSVVNAYFVMKSPNTLSETLKAVTAQAQAAKEQEEKAHQKKSRQSALPAVMMPVLLLGSIYCGVLTATEAAAFSVVYSLIVGIFYYKKIDWNNFQEAMISAGRTSGVIMVMLFAVGILSRLYMTENLPDVILNFLSSITSNKYILIILLNVFMVIIGMLMDDCSGTILCAPLLMPIMEALGVSPIHFAAILSVNIGMGNITPPTAPLLYLAGRVAGSEVKQMLKPTFALIAFAWIPVLIVTTFIPELSLFLPRFFGLM